MSSDAGAAIQPLSDLVDRLEQRDAAGYEVDGLVPLNAVRPSNVDELQELVRAARAEEAALIPWGGGTQMGFGNNPSRYAIAVDLRDINDVLRYEPDDMTMSVQTGCRLADLNRMLDENRQVLPVDAAFPEDATIGGLTAVGASGPRRLGYGPLRDLIIGMTVLMPDGTLATAGGQVVKNVTGFDMMRLHHGALGSLGIIVSLNLKVIPKPPSERTVVARYASFHDANRAAVAVVESQLGVTALVVTNPAASADFEVGESRVWTLSVRCEAPPSSVVRQAERVIEYLRDGADDVRVDEDTAASEKWWDRICLALDQRLTARDVGIRFGVPSSRMALFEDSFQASTQGLETAVKLTLDYGSGLAYARPDDGEPFDSVVPALLDMTHQVDHVSLLAAPTTLKHELDVFGGRPAGFSMIESLKNTFDPDRIMNPGRYIGRL